jgi:hypothetical protein
MRRPPHSGDRPFVIHIIYQLIAVILQHGDRDPTEATASLSFTRGGRLSANAISVANPGGLKAS